MSDNPKPDLQDPLPEANWLWRRVFVFLVTAAILWFLWGAMDRLGNVAVLRPELGVPALLGLCKWIISFTGIMATYYMIAPSAEQIVKMLQTAGLLKAGVQIAQRTVETPERREVVSTVAQPPQPVVPPASTEEPATLPDEMPPISGGNGPGSYETGFSATHPCPEQPTR